MASLGGCGAGRRGAEREREDDWKRKVAMLVEVSSGYEEEKMEDILRLLLV